MKIVERLGNPCESFAIVNLSRVAVAGATGYSGQELLNLLAHHPYFRVEKLIGREDNVRALKGKIDLAFLCTPNEVSLEMAPLLLDEGIHVIDVSGIFRLKKHSYPEWYGIEHSSPKWLEKAEYSLVGWHKLAPAQAGHPRLIANPGCYPTACLLALLPLIKEGCINLNSIILDAKSGTSGAGKKAETKLLFSEIFGEFSPYKVGKHQHFPEIKECIKNLTSVDVNPCFTTSLLPVERGISVSLYADYSAELAALPTTDRLEKVLNAYKEQYLSCSDIRFGFDPALASLKKVVRSNRAHIQINEAFGKLVIFSTIDNLLRGAAGQALLNANQLAERPLQEGIPQ